MAKARSASGGSVRLRITIVGIPAATLLGGLALSLRDLRVGFVAATFALGWTQLVACEERRSSER
jgi:hypothetical protein